MDDFFRQNLASLKGSEVKLLVALLAFGKRPNSELMRLSGVTDHRTFYSALKHLRELGVISPPYLRGWENLPNGGEQLAFPTNISWQNQPRLGNPTEAGREIQVGKPNSGRESQQLVQNPTDDPVSMDFESALAYADAMDGSGVQTSLKSPYQQRRKQQCVLLQEAWPGLFPEDPVDPHAFVLFLQATKDNASEVYAAMLEAHLRGVEHPKAYILKILRSPKKQATVAQQDEPGMLRPVTDEQRKAWQDNEKQLAGVLSGWSF